MHTYILKVHSNYHICMLWMVNLWSGGMFGDLLEPIEIVSGTGVSGSPMWGRDT